MTGAPSGTASTSIPPRSGDIHVGQKTNRHAPFTNGESSKVPVNSGKLYQETQPFFRSLHNNGLYPSHIGNLRLRGVSFPVLPFNLSHGSRAITLSSPNGHVIFIPLYVLESRFLDPLTSSNNTPLLCSQAIYVCW